MLTYKYSGYLTIINDDKTLTTEDLYFELFNPRVITRNEVKELALEKLSLNHKIYGVDSVSYAMTIAQMIYEVT